MPITKQEVEKIATLANLALSEAEKETFTSQLSAIVTYVEKLNQLDTSNVAPMSHSTISGEAAFTMREDETQPPLGQELALSNAPDAGDGHFKLPKVIG